MINRLLVCLIISLFFSFSGLAQANETNMQIRKCAQITVNQARLNCFDSLVQALSITKPDVSHLSGIADKTTIASTAVPPPVVNALAEIKKTASIQKQESFGKQHLKSDVEEIESVIFVIEKVEKLKNDKWKIYFKNGQIWHQADSLSIRLSADDSVKLSTGFASVIYLKKIGKNKRIRVKRIK